MSDNVLAVGLFWRNDLGCASVVPSEQTDSEYINLDLIIMIFFLKFEPDCFFFFRVVSAVMRTCDYMCYFKYAHTHVHTHHIHQLLTNIFCKLIDGSRPEPAAVHNRQRHRRDKYNRKHWQKEGHVTKIVDKQVVQQNGCWITQKHILPFFSW